ncbi:class A beta-lactamase-related serine hydrolase [Neobacillus mesonae]|nr:class A beta-lactamase-related serine hydrolase [Neobacillus mesonae]
MNTILWIIFGVIVLLLAVVFIGSMRFRRELEKTGPGYFASFIEENKDNPRLSMVLQYNHHKIVEIHPRELLPLASTVKILIAIEYARQAADGGIDPEMNVKLDELNHYYVPKTDGGAHEAWISQLEQKNNTVSVPLSEVAYGMIAFSSNANTEYLIRLLGLDHINELITTLNLEQHEYLYPLVSSLFIPGALMKEKNLSKNEALAEFKKMDLAEYRNRAIAIHKRIAELPLTEQDKKQVVGFMSMDVQRLWSDRLPRSTAKDYVSIMEKLNSKTYFSADIHRYLDPVMEGLMRNPHNQEWLSHAGQKGGSTLFVLTNAMYATDKRGNSLELAVFVTDLTWKEQAKLSHSLNGFQLKLLTDDEFRNSLK